MLAVTEDVGQCGVWWHYNQDTDACYMVGQTFETWESAKSLCEASGGSLLGIDSFHPDDPYSELRYILGMF